MRIFGGLLSHWNVHGLVSRFSCVALVFVGECRVGCMLAGFLLNREPFFRGKDNEDQLLRIALVLGTQGLFKFLRKYGKQMNRGGGT